MTAVEWLYEKLVDRQNGKGDSRSWGEIFQQAKELEKQQIIDASNNSYFNSGLIKRSSQNKKVYSLGEQYYTKTYGK